MLYTTILLFILAALCFIFFEAIPTTIVSDPIANHLLCGFIARLGLGLLFGWTLYLFAGKSMFTFNKTFAVNLAWSLPCFMVALVNFPYSAIISKEVTIDYANLLGLYILFVVSIALLEEFIFRGIVLLVVKDYLNGKKHAPLKIVVICSAIFSLFHLTNLLTPNPDVGGVLLQCVYTFLIGAMLTVTMLKLKNIWLCN